MSDIVGYLLAALAGALALWAVLRRGGDSPAAQLTAAAGAALAKAREAERVRTEAAAKASTTEEHAREELAANAALREETEDAIDGWERDELARPVGDRLDDPGAPPPGVPRRGPGGRGAGG